MSRKRILLLHTGGTFGMVPMEPRQTLAPNQMAERIIHHVPEIEQIAEIDYQMVFNIDSADIQAHHWQTLANIIHSHIAQYDGFVIIHGTDSMVYTAAALSFMLKNLPKPVILTGSQRPLAMIRTDARTNLINSVELATYPIPEVGIFFGTRLFRGNRTCKISSTHFEAFDSPNYPPLAEVGLDIRIFNRHLRRKGTPQLETRLSDRVLTVPFFPNLNPDYLSTLINSPLQAIVIEALGLGNVAVAEKSLIPFVEALSAAGKLVVVTSQSIEGGVDLTRYRNGWLLQEAGAIGAGDMTTSTTLVKLMHLLGKFGDQTEKVKKWVTRDIAGEITVGKNL